MAYSTGGVYLRSRTIVVAGNTVAQLLDVTNRLAVARVTDLNTGYGGEVECGGTNNRVFIYNSAAPGGVGQFQGITPANNANVIGLYWDGAKYAIKNCYAASHTFFIDIICTS